MPSKRIAIQVGRITIDSSGGRSLYFFTQVFSSGYFREIALAKDWLGRSTGEPNRGINLGKVLQ